MLNEGAVAGNWRLSTRSVVNLVRSQVYNTERRPLFAGYVCRDAARRAGSSSKSREIVFRTRRIRGRSQHPAPPCIDIERVDKLTILGVLVNNNLTATDHVSTVLASCASLMYALRVLRGHGLSEQSLKDVFQATVVGKLLYCAPAWSGFCSAADCTRLNSFLRRCDKLGYMEKHHADISTTFQEADDALFRTLSNISHFLHTYLSERPETAYSLRTRSHNKLLIPKTSDLGDRHFIIRSLYKNLY